ncbi:MAG: S-layer homology domain-containing protein [Eubacteriales bacterium]|nr:S-layer homology domain-containing protein [Eubacteriales bacterium]
MKKALLLIIIVLLLSGSMNTAQADTYYFDIYNHWAEMDIYQVTNNLKIFQGYGDFTFRPDRNISIAEYFKVLYKIGNENGVVNLDTRGTVNYSDITISHWAYTYVLSFNSYMIQNPSVDYTIYDVFPGDRLNPNSFITRQQAAALTAALNLPPVSAMALPFTDIIESNRFYNELVTLYNNGIILGYSNNEFRGAANLTRAEAAVLTKRIYGEAAYNKVNTMSGLAFSNKDFDNGFPFFYTYDNRNLTDDDFRYIKAVTTLEYLSFGGYIFPGDEPLYDTNPIKTLNELKSEGYFNVFGLNYYLLKNDNLTAAMKLAYSNEILNAMIADTTIAISNRLLLFHEILKNGVDNKAINYLVGLKNGANDIFIQSEIDFLIFKHYMSTNQMAGFYELLVRYNNLPLNPAAFVNVNNGGVNITNSTVMNNTDRFKLMEQYILNVTFGLHHVGFSNEAEAFITGYYNRLISSSLYGSLSNDDYRNIIGTIKKLKLINQ